MSHTPCGRCKRPCDFYCIQEASAKCWEELNDAINAFLDSKSERMTYQMCGFKLTLNRNGTYSLDDTTGG